MAHQREVILSNRTLIELNHDYCPKNERAAEIFGLKMQMFMMTGEESDLPQGAKLISWRHHSENFVIGKTVEGFEKP